MKPNARKKERKKRLAGPRNIQIARSADTGRAGIEAKPEKYALKVGGARRRAAEIVGLGRDARSRPPLLRPAARRLSEGVSRAPSCAPPAERQGHEACPSLGAALGLWFLCSCLLADDEAVRCGRAGGLSVGILGRETGDGSRKEDSEEMSERMAQGRLYRHRAVGHIGWVWASRAMPSCTKSVKNMKTIRVLLYSKKKN
jgi:hypothetical protein